jgi:hypothetical protein
VTTGIRFDNSMHIRNKVGGRILAVKGAFLLAKDDTRSEFGDTKE